MAKPTFLSALSSAIVPKAAPASATAVAENRGGWWSLIKEPFAGAWQRNITVDYNSVLSYNAVYACITLIAADISKLCVELVQEDADGIWTEVDSPAYSPVLRKPNRYQNRIQFWETYILSKLMRGNVYVLKQRDNRQVVTALYVLDPNRVKVLVADDGSAWYQLSSDNLAAIGEPVTVPASEIIHDRFNCLFHPLVGTSPIFAAGMAATQGLAIQNGSAAFFGNRSQPGGVLTAPNSIDDATANRLKEAWETKFSGDNVGRVAVLGDGLHYERMVLTAEESQLIDQLKWTAEVVCSVFHVPPYKIGLGTMPTYNNIQSLNVEYYSQCLQSLIEAAELCLDEGLGIGEGVVVNGKTYGVEFDVDNLLRMDSVTQMDMLDKGKNYFTPDEGRKKLNLPKKPGGDAVYRQQQDFSLEALAKRDAQADPFATNSKTTNSSTVSQTSTDAGSAANDNAARAAAAIALRRGLDDLRRQRKGKR
ncbi:MULTISPECIES: phage portal protein [unclassified Mesorhizobium]|uniref:phage portal protein n=1 Tax=unclassified Mesorhizobium TaxID=325217 RepID=UPI000FDB08C3|nr:MULTISPECIES: phage portal protein [unclassified Mesorhizobium]TGT76724.1 phage portal protein [Mesorhizobium sp. M2E.F.Ca.ET.166.01.1.1]TGW02836.1 phage portal protein [Mesorhizobium sp. M2E.F.Ca.ET.154.01.1.1]